LPIVGSNCQKKYTGKEKSIENEKGEEWAQEAQLAVPRWVIDAKEM